MEADYLLSDDTGKKIFMRNQDVVSRKVVGELFLVPVKGKLADMEEIFALTAVAEYIWDRLDGQRNLIDIRNEVVARFEVSDEQAGADIYEFVKELLEAGLVREMGT
jgi:hypothetical protein